MSVRAVNQVLRDIVFAAPVGFRPLSLDLHLPASTSEGGAPVVLFVHGGGWRLGSRAVFCPNLTSEQSFERIVAAGFAVASVDYRLSGEAKFPAQVDDVRAALAWLRGAADEYGLDASRIIVWGESAGATLGALVALEPGSGVLAVIDWYGPANLESMARRQSPEEAAVSREAEWLGVSAYDDPALARRASPVFAVHEGAPAFLIAHGTADRFVPPAQSDELAAALRAHGVPVDVESVEGAGHMWADAPDIEGLVTRAIAFATRVAALR